MEPGERNSRDVFEKSPAKDPQEEKLTKIARLLKSKSEVFGQMENGEAIIKEHLKNPIFDRALGCVYGAFIGDALGSYCEFEKNISDNKMNDVMQMPGGGTFGTAPGQLTDDSELALHLGMGLNTYDSQRTLKEQHSSLLKKIAEQYISWVQKGRPFDIGMTTSCAIRKLTFSQAEVDSDKYLELAKREVNLSNCDSQSNGCLMRITPMAAFVTALTGIEPEEDIERLVRGISLFNSDEVQLTHSNHVVVDACAEWVWLLRSLIRRDQKVTLKSIYELTQQRCNKNSKLKPWIDQAKEMNPMPGVSKMGWAKIAWSYGLHYLRRISDKESENELCPQLYKSIIRIVIQEGGDTDTNACIVGGMMGSILGFRKLPLDYVQKAFEVDCTKSPQKRKPIYNPKNAFDIVMRMFAVLPK